MIILNPFSFKLYSYLTFLLSVNFLYSQYTISGVVKDSLGNPIGASNVYLKQKEKAIIAYTYANEKGVYKLQTDRTGEFTISFSALGYAKKDYSLLLSENTEIHQDAILYNLPYELGEVIINSERAITEKKDTIIFDISSFKQGEESVVEDILRKLPGVEVSETGTIKVDGREVEKIMIEGDDFFKKGYKLMTKNLDVEAVSKVEVLRRYSNNKLLKGIEESDKVALNLKLNDDFKRKWFGTIAPGYGLVSENTYDVEANISSFGKKNKYFLLGSLNNVGEDVTDDVHGLINAQDNYEEPGSVGKNQRAFSLVSFYATVPGLKKSRANFNNAELVSLNSIFKVSPKINLKVLGLFNSDNNKFFRDGIDTFFVNNAMFANNENYFLNKSTDVGFGRLELTYDISEIELLEYEGKYNISSFYSNSELVFNNTKNREVLAEKNHLHDHLVKYSYRFRDNKILVLSGRYINENKPQKYSNYRFLFQELFPTINSVNTIDQTNKNKFDYLGVKSYLLDRRKNDDLLDFNISYEYRNDILVSDFWLKENHNILLVPDAYQNNEKYKTHDISAGSGFRKKLNKTDIAFSFNAHQLFNQLDEINKEKKDAPFFINSKFNFKWEIDKSNKVFAFAENTNSNTRLSDVYGKYVLTSARSFTKGTNEFNQLNSTRIFAGYNLGRFGDRFIANISLSYAKDNDFLSTNSIITQNYIQSTKIIIPNRQYYGINTNIERYFRFIRNNLKLKFNYMYSEFKNIVNSSELRLVKTKDYTYGFELRSGFRGFFNYHLGSIWKETQIEVDTKNIAIQNTSFLDLSFVFSSKFNIQIQTERYTFNKLKSRTNDYYFLDFELNYKPKNKNLNFSVLGNNLINTKVFRNYSISDTNISTTEFRLLPRYILLKVSLKF